MNVVESLAEVRLARASLSQPVGFVPTMGSLHEGHLSLVRQARHDCSSVVVSIYVNPTQFGPNEDFNNYPRDLQRDLALLRSEGVDLVWTPNDKLMYPTGYQTWVVVEDVTKIVRGGDPSGAFSRSSDGCDQTLQRSSAPQSIFRAKRCSTSYCHRNNDA